MHGDHVEHPSFRKEHGDDPYYAMQGRQWHYLSVTSLTLQAECRAALIEAIFFDESEGFLRKCVIGSSKVDYFTGNTLLVPNGPNHHNSIGPYKDEQLSIIYNDR